MIALRAEGLWVEQNVPGGARAVLRDVDLDVPSGRVTVLLGETGVGKTLLARALSGLLPDGFRVTRGRILYRGRRLDGPGAWQGVRGRELFYAPQNAAACLNPVMTIGRQVRECSDLGAGEITAMLARLRFADPERVLRSYPCSLSGGENQRCLLALALASRARLLILDEPTSEIDATAQEEFIQVLQEYRRRRSLTILLISHHLGFVGQLADSLCVLHRGEVVASGEPGTVLGSPRHPYVRDLASYLASS
ncbi:MAG: ABC transporter ATP-binding protein [Candidatus Aminicenantes bacterium]|nr:ABC transporter ATP-binding protein [Candidatus Aminicenantes bacterium]